MLFKIFTAILFFLSTLQSNIIKILIAYTCKTEIHLFELFLNTTSQFFESTLKQIVYMTDNGMLKITKIVTNTDTSENFVPFFKYFPKLFRKLNTESF